MKRSGRVLVYKETLLPPSETFVVAQAAALTRYEYLLAGHAEEGHEQIAIASVLQPLDRVARNLLQREGVEVMTAGTTPPPTSLGAAERRSAAPGFLR